MRYIASFDTDAATDSHVLKLDCGHFITVPSSQPFFFAQWTMMWCTRCDGEA
jgi:hypothetical protein